MEASMRIAIDHLSADQLSQESWAFYITDNWHGHDGIAVVLDTYTISKRATAGEKLRAQCEWSRWGTRGFGGVIKLDKPPKVPQWVRSNVLQKIQDSIVFVNQPDAPMHRSDRGPQSGSGSSPPRDQSETI